MPSFDYVSVAETGQRRGGVVRAASRQDAIKRLLELGHHPLQLAESHSEGERRRGIKRVFRGISTSDLAVFTRQLAALLKAGLPIVQALSTLRKQCSNARLTCIVEQIEQALSEQACSFSEALERHPDEFDAVYRGLVRSGEESGNLAEVLGELARHLAKSAKLRGQVLGAFIYPAFLLVLGSGAVLALMTFVLPRFQTLFDSFGQTLPLPTKALMAVSAFLASWWWALIASFLAAVLAIVGALKRPRVRAGIDRCLLSFPMIGPVIVRVEVARISHTLAVLLESGLPLLTALAITRDTARNLAIRGTFSDLIHGVSVGATLAACLEKSGLYPGMLVSLVRTGEETGELTAMLGEMSRIYEDEAERALTGAVKLLEPLLIIFMGGIITGIVAAVILPIFRANAMVAG